MATQQAKAANPVQTLRAAVGAFAKLQRENTRLTKQVERLQAKGPAAKGAAKNAKANGKAAPKGKRVAAEDDEDAPVRAKKVVKKVAAKKGVAKKVVAKKGPAAKKGKVVAKKAAKGKPVKAAKKSKDDDFLL
jgi:hypothetical protein